MDKLGDAVYHNPFVLSSCNDRTGHSFQPERGIREWDPICLYIFIICAEYLGKYVYFIFNHKKSGIGFKLAKDWPNILSLVFADDCVKLLRQ